VEAAVRGVRLTLHDLFGREVRRVEKAPGKGNARTTLDARGLHPGLYLLRATDGSEVQERTVLLL
jgi:hypothetical protein